LTSTRSFDVFCVVAGLASRAGTVGRAAAPALLVFAPFVLPPFAMFRIMPAVRGRMQFAKPLITFHAPIATVR
jgi:hypothetical protein